MDRLPEPRPHSCGISSVILRAEKQELGQRVADRSSLRQRPVVPAGQGRRHRIDWLELGTAAAPVRSARAQPVSARDWVTRQLESPVWLVLEARPVSAVPAFPA